MTLPESDLVTDRSRALSERLQRVMPGGDTRSVTFYQPYPIALDHGEGYAIWDVDGNRYVNFLNNYTSLVHGHAAPAIVAAMLNQASRGTAFPAPHPVQAELAERICARFPTIERVRFTNSGSEATMLAVRAARAYTGRDHLVKAYEGYHGSWDQVSVSRKPQPGVPGAVRGLAHQFDYNNAAQLTSVMHEHGSQVAAIILEPVLCEGGIIAATPEFFATARALADQYGTLLIADEIVTARLRAGGYQAALGVQPDLTTLGKIIGGGLPVGAVGGRAEIMDIFNPRNPSFVSHSGTFNGNPMSMAAGCASLDLLTEAEIARINALGTRLAEGLRSLFAHVSAEASITECGSLVQVHLPDAQMGRFHRASLEEGVFFAPRGLLNISTAMDAAIVNSSLAALGRAVERLSIAEPVAAGHP